MIGGGATLNVLALWIESEKFDLHSSRDITCRPACNRGTLSSSIAVSLKR